MDVRKVYLVDTENVAGEWRWLLSSMRTKDMLILFYTEHSRGILYDDLEMILKYPCAIKLERCVAGKNALDFQLVSHLGYLIRTAPKSNYIIVSDDTGYDAVIKYWKNFDVSVTRMNMKDIPGRIRILKNKKEMDPSVERWIKAILKEEAFEEAEVDVICDIICEYSEEQLQTLYATLLKEFGHQRGVSIYQLFKPHLREIYHKISA